MIDSPCTLELRLVAHLEENEIVGMAAWSWLTAKDSVSNLSELETMLLSILDLGVETINRFCYLSYFFKLLFLPFLFIDY